MSKLSMDFIARILGAIFMSILGGMGGVRLAGFLETSTTAYGAIFSMIGFLAGLVLTPFFTTWPIRRAREKLLGMSPENLVAMVIGAFLGLIAATLVIRPLSLLPDVVNQISSLIAAATCVYLGITIMVARQHDLWSFFSNFKPLIAASSNSTEFTQQKQNVILLDTSVIIDGRIADVSKTGFIRDTFLVPGFVLHELQFVADSEEVMRRNRGKRGLEVLQMLQHEAAVPVQITDMDVSKAREVDSKLIDLARHLQCPIMTNDYNLNQVASLQGVTVLNINDLAKSIKTAYLPGEDLAIKVVQKGREEGQGVGYLEDGTMVVVENGSKRVDEDVEVVVTKMLQTSAGRMIFARLNGVHTS